jgi:hypothetical protein
MWLKLLVVMIGAVVSQVSLLVLFSSWSTTHVLVFAGASLGLLGDILGACRFSDFTFGFASFVIGWLST